MSSSIVQKVAAAQPFDNEDQEFWWKATGTTFSSLLEKSGYTPEQTEYHLGWYRRYVTASLGPRPIPGKKYPFTTGPVRDGSNVEFSINWTENTKNTRRIRFCIGAVDDKAGTDADPFGQQETERILTRMKETHIPDLSFKRFKIFTDHLFIKKEDEAAALAKIPKDMPRVQIWVAFDVQPKLNAKVYFTLFNKVLAASIHPNQLLYNIAQECSCQNDKSFMDGVNTFKAYCDSFEDRERAPISHLLSLDCADGPDARIKTYVGSHSRTLNEVKDLWTLGGRCHGPDVDAGIQALEQFWPIFYGLDPAAEDIANVAVVPEGHGMHTSVEFKAGKAMPDLKLQFPVDAISATDEELAARLASFFRLRGNGEYADHFTADMKESL